MISGGVRHITLWLSSPVGLDGCRGVIWVVGAAAMAARASLELEATVGDASTREDDRVSDGAKTCRRGLVGCHRGHHHSR